jgi:hypothetical protein
LRARPLHNHLVREQPKQCQSSTNSSKNLASQRSSTSVSLNNKEKLQSQTKPQGLLGTMIVNVVTPSRCIVLILMVAGHQKTGKRILGHCCKKEVRKPSTRDLPVQSARWHTKLRPRSQPRPIHIQAPYCMYHGSETNHRTKDYPSTPTSLHSNRHLEKLTIPCNWFPTTNTLHLTLRSFHRSLPKQPSLSSSLLPVISLCHNQPPPVFTNSTNNIPSDSATDHIPNANPQVKIEANPPQPPPPQIQEPPK